MKLQVSVLTCGRCGKPRGRYHACAGRSGRRDTVGLRLRFTCPRCGKETRNPLSHTCSPKSDFKKRRRAAERAEKTRLRRERERKRKAEAAARRKAAAAKRRAEAKAKPRRKRTAAHVPRLCQDAECQRYGCLKYREGWEDGYAEGFRHGYLKGYRIGHADGYREGYDAGFAAASAKGGK